MRQIDWQESLSVGIDIIDSQHRTWIKHFNDTARAVATRENRVQISRTLGFLVDYSEAHFATEEQIMLANDYPELGEHRARHEELRTTLASLVQEYEEEGATENLAEGIENFLGNWLVNHIRDVDARFGAFVREREMGA